jgi:SpoVK/Ycf46/Vps4 family AAA+-type ATPase
MTEIYENNIQYLLEELRRIDLIVRFNLKNWRLGQDVDDFQGLYISENEVNAILQNPPYEIKKNDLLDQDLEKIRALASEINKRKIESINNGKELCLHILTEIFHLKPFEVDAILICLASELDLRYEKLYSYMQNDVTRKRPTVDLVIKLLCNSFQERLRAREYFSSNAPMIKNRLVNLSGDGQELPLLSKSIKIDERIISFLLGTDGIDRRIENFSSIIKPIISFNDVIFEDDHKNRIVEMMKQLSGLKMPIMLYFQGAYGTGKKIFAQAVCREIGRSLLLVNAKALMKNDSFETLSIIMREALLQDSCVYFEGIDVLWKEKDGSNVTDLIHELDQFPAWIFLSGEQQWGLQGILEKHKFMSIQFPLPSFALRKRLWRSFLDGNSDGIDMGALAAKFKFSGGQIRDAVFSAYNLGAAKGRDELSIDDLYIGCKTQSNRNLSVFASKIEPRYNWNDIILPEDTKEQLREVTGYINYKGTVYTDWGFDRKLSLGKGLNVLFSGPSGTGKTMAAEIIANDAGLDLYKIDLSSVVSKYIGETEKNLKNIFKEAETSNAILFFDEADALFGRRSEVKDSHDRYANIEINYLLQKMEEYEGIVILATNLSNNIDEAFMRRMHFKIEFALPDEKLREKIWRNIFPKDTPLSENIDYSFLSKLKITGGNIKNVALNAAFLAASNSRVVTMGHIIIAMRREFQKNGKLCVKGDFGVYYKIIEDGIKHE